MQTGVVFPQTEIGADPAVVKDYVQTIEGLGYDYLLAYEHVVGANPERPEGWSGRYSYQDAFHEPFVLFSYLSALTQKLTFVTGVVILPQRPAVLVAKQAAQVDLLSGGRLQLGVGIGWNALEFQALGYSFHDRGRRIEEQVAVMRALWTRPLVTFQGKYHTLDDVGINPLPVQRPIPVWMGGTADVVLRRTARIADGYHAQESRPEDGKDRLARLRTHLLADGRDPKTFGINVRIRFATIPEREWAACIQGWLDLGVTHIGINTMDAGLATVQAHLDVIARFKAVVDDML